MDPLPPRETWTAALRRAAAPASRPAARRPLPRWVVPAALAALAVVLGTLGSLMTGYAPGDSAPLAHAIYNAVRCFSLNGPADGDLAWPLDVARFLAPLATVWGAVAALLAATAGRRHSRRVLRGAGHTVVAGLGADGTRLALEALDAGVTVVALERDEGAVGLAAVRERGGVALVGDACDPRALARAGVPRAAALVLALSSDADGLAAAASAAALPRERPERLRVLARCSDPELARAVQRRRFLGGDSGHARLALFSRDAAAARQLVCEHLAGPLARAANAGRVPHVLFVGAGPGFDAALARLLESPATAALPAVEVTLACADAETRVARLAAGLEAGVARWHASPVDLRAPDDVLAALARVHAGRPVDAAVLHADDAEIAASSALRSASVARPGVPLFVRLREGRGLVPLLGAAAESSVAIFGEDRDVAAHEVVVGDALDLLARRVHEDYRRGAGGAVPAWEDLDPDLRHSNRAQADHVAQKLALLGRTLREGTEPVAPDDVERLSRVEHVRWCAERLLAGWRHAPGSKDVAARTSPDLVPWEALTEESRERDRDVVRRIPALCAALLRGPAR